MATLCESGKIDQFVADFSGLVVFLGETVLNEDPQHVRFRFELNREPIWLEVKENPHNFFINVRCDIQKIPPLRDTLIRMLYDFKNVLASHLHLDPRRINEVDGKIQLYLMK